MPKANVRNFRLRVVLRPGSALGPGKIDLLEAIAETGSIRAAGSRFKMSYRRAWSLIAELNAMFEAPLVLAETGGRGGGGATLTPLGREVVTRFRRMEAGTAAAIEADTRRLDGPLDKGAGDGALDRALFLIGNNAREARSCSSAFAPLFLVLRRRGGAQLRRSRRRARSRRSSSPPPA